MTFKEKLSIDLITGMIEFKHKNIEACIHEIEKNTVDPSTEFLSKLEQLKNHLILL